MTQLPIQKIVVRLYLLRITWCVYIKFPFVFKGLQDLELGT